MSPAVPAGRTLAVAVTATALLAAALGAHTATAAAAASTDKVLVIGVDGAVLDRVKAANAPHLQGLMAQGLTARSTLYAGPMAATSSGPGWSTIATGVWPDKHGVKDNSFTGKNYAAYPDFLTRIENARPALNTYAAADWEPITSTDQNGPIFSAKVDKRLSLKGDRDGYRGEDPKVAAAAATELRTQNPDAAFVYLGEIDAAGHSYGAASQQYLDAVARVDALVGQLLTAVQNRPTYGQENWKVMVTTDHGHTLRRPRRLDHRRARHLRHRQGRRHPRRVGPRRRQARRRRRDRPRPARRRRPRHRRRAAGLPGQRPLRHGAPGPPGPGGRDGHPGRGEGLHAHPARRLVRRQLEDGDGRCHRVGGWAFATDEFWTQSQRDQWRELNVRSRDVFAVADSDEWDDKSHTGTFDSTLVTPKWPVAGGSTRTLTFQTHYRHEAGQTAQVLVSYNGAAPAVVKTYTADAVAKADSVALQVPAGATDVQVRFRYSGNNNWFWTVDNVRLG